MKVFASIALLLLASATLCAQEPVNPPAPPLEAKIVLKAPSSAVRVGELVRLDVSESTGDSFRWLLIPDSITDWEVYAEGRKAVFSAREPGEYRFIVACALSDSVDVLTHVIRVVGPPTAPTTDSLTSWIHYWMWSYELPRDQAEALADSFSTLAARNDLIEPQDWIKATAEANREALGSDIDAWVPLLDKIGSALLKKAQDGELMTPEQHAAVWMEIAEGLRRG